MSCPHIAQSVADYFDESLTPALRKKHESHLLDCEDCRREVSALQTVPRMLEGWRNEAVPDWDRAAAIRPARLRKSLPLRSARWPAVARWMPLAASLVLAVAVLAQTRLDVTDTGWSLSFGQSSAGLDAGQLDAYLAAYIGAQNAETRQWVEATLRTHGETTADGIYQWMSWMEQQRQLDVQRMEAGFQQLLDRDFQTVDSVRQLASYVMYQELP